MKVNHRLILFVCLIQLISLVTYGQKYKSHKVHGGNIHSNECSTYFDFKRKDIVFHSVTEYDYTFWDTTFRYKKLYQVITNSFNRQGLMEQEVVKDSNGVKLGLTTNVYDTNNRLIHTIFYAAGTVPGNFYKVSESIYAYNKMGGEVKDSEISFDEMKSVKDLNSGKDIDTGTWYGKSVVYTTYNEKGNVIKQTVIKQTVIKQNDTSIETIIYDARGYMSEDQQCEYGNVTIHKFHFINDTLSGDETTINLKDTNDIKKEFDNKYRLTAERVYHNHKLTYSRMNDYRADGSYTETCEEYPDENSDACLNDSRTITVYDKYRNIVSQTTMNHKNGTEINITVTHKYIYAGNKIASDTTIRIEDGNMYSSKSMEVTLNRYDNSGDLLFSEVRGGGLYSDNSRDECEYNQQHQLVKELYYSSCFDKPYKTRMVEYYPDGITCKIDKLIEGNQTTIEYYGNDGRKLTEIRLVENGPSYKSVYKYEE